VKYYVTLCGKELVVELSRDAGATVRARVGGEEHDVDLSEVAPLRHYSVLLDRHSFDVVVEASGRELIMQMVGHRIAATVESERERAARSIEASAPSGKSVVRSAMPGVIRAVLVRTGDAVNHGQALVILEAMKMENEIRSDRAGVVDELFVDAGVAVEGGAPLLTIEPSRA